MKSDTIAAIATAFSEAGIGIIRISGEDSFEIVDRIFLCKKDFEKWVEAKKNDLSKDNSESEIISENRGLKDLDYCRTCTVKNAKTYTLHYGYIIDGNSVIDEVLVSVMRAPKSYTAENVVEINCHGGILVLQKILELVIKNGARVAEPGEFTKRAFLNGRMDLSEAEAVMDLIHSKNEFALQASMGQLKGSVSSIVRKLRGEIIYEIAFIESALDDPENYSTDGYGEKLFGVLGEVERKIGDLLNRADHGRILKEGIKTVILGKPNAGKSSFLNELLGEERAIVTDIPGTTRDVLQEDIMLGGVSLHVIDTAGIRSTEDKIEKIGVEKARKYAKDADLIVYIVDSSVDLDESDEEILEILKEKRFIVLLNKSDLDAAVTEDELTDKLKSFFVSLESGHEKEKNVGGEDTEKNYEIIKISALKHQGIDEFEETVKRMFFKGDISFNHEVIITSMRHKEALLEAQESISMVKQSIEAGMPEDFYSIDLMNAYGALGKIIGEEVGDDLVNEIFEKFCMGK